MLNEMGLIIFLLRAFRVSKLCKAKPASLWRLLVLAFSF